MTIKQGGLKNEYAWTWVRPPGGRCRVTSTPLGPRPPEDEVATARSPPAGRPCLTPTGLTGYNDLTSRTRSTRHAVSGVDPQRPRLGGAGDLPALQRRRGRQPDHAGPHPPRADHGQRIRRPASDELFRIEPAEVDCQELVRRAQLYRKRSEGRHWTEYLSTTGSNSGGQRHPRGRGRSHGRVRLSSSGGHASARRLGHPRPSRASGLLPRPAEPEVGAASRPGPR
jgi:hypothetical protein